MRIEPALAAGETTTACSVSISQPKWCPDRFQRFRIARKRCDDGSGATAGNADRVGFHRCRSSARMERVMGIEPTSAAWEAAVLPLNYTREPLILFVLVTSKQPPSVRSPVRQRTSDVSTQGAPAFGTYNATAARARMGSDSAGRLTWTRQLRGLVDGWTGTIRRVDTRFESRDDADCDLHSNARHPIQARRPTPVGRRSDGMDA